MSDIINTVCPACGRLIAAEDDIRICASCGTKHHVLCWDENGGCGEPGCEGKEYIKKKTEDVRCVVCNAALSESARFCHVCGEPKTENRICSRCGAFVSEEQNYCIVCGEKLK